MQKIAKLTITSAATVLLGLGFSLATHVAIADEDLDSAVCTDKTNPPQDVVTQGFCIAINRKKGNCMGCHAIPNVTSGNIAPPMLSMKQRFPDKAKLRAQIWDPRKANPNTVMPPFGEHNILSPEEVDKVVEYVLTL